MTEKEMSLAKQEFYLRYHRHQETDELLEPFLNVKHTTGWLVRVRKASFLSQEAVAKRMGIKTPSYGRLELQEARVLTSLADAAAAMDCELVYAIRPKDRQSFMMRTWNALYPLVKDFKNIETAGNKSLRLAYLVNMMLYHPQVRRTKGWVRNTEPDALIYMPREVSRS